MSICTDCALSAQQDHWGFTSGCKGCAARSLGRIFLAKGDRGRRFKRACEQLGISESEVRQAHEADAMGKEIAG